MLKQRVLLISLLMTVLVLATSAAIYAQDDADKKSLSFIKDYLTYLTNGGNFSGVVLVARGDDILLNEAYGMANIEWSVRNTPDGKFRIAAITKQFTAMAILLLQEQGKLKIGDPICNYVEECAPAWADITIDQLLTQSDGIADLFYGPIDPLVTQSLAPNQLMSMLLRKEILFTPGTQWAASDSGYVLLGQIITNASGQSYQRFLEGTFFNPLGMTNTGYDNPKQVVKQRVTGYVNRLTTADVVMPDNFYSAGAFYSTTDDLLKWTRGIFQGNVLTSKTLQSLLDTLKNSKDPQDAHYGFEYETDQGHRFVHQEGNFPGFASTIDYFLDDDVTVVVLSNIETARPFELVQTIFRFIFKVA